jgi:hypothetical protein
MPFYYLRNSSFANLYNLVSYSMCWYRHCPSVFSKLPLLP